MDYHALKASGIPARPGLYALFCQAPAALDQLRSRLGGGLAPGLLYVGDTGVRTMRGGKSSSGTLRTRLNNHFGAASNASASTVRRTFGCLLGLPACQPERNNPRFLPEAERSLTTWMGQHLLVTVWAAPEQASLRGVEKLVLAELRPPLDLDRAAASPFRAQLMGLRKQIAAAARSTPCP